MRLDQLLQNKSFLRKKPKICFECMCWSLYLPTLLIQDSLSFFHGCSTFLPVFDANTDTYEALHDRSPFAVNCICMVAARVRDGGGERSIDQI